MTNSILTDERSAAGSTPLSWKLISTTAHSPVNRLLEAVDDRSRPSQGREHGRSIGTSKSPRSEFIGVRNPVRGHMAERRLDRLLPESRARIPRAFGGRKSYWVTSRRIPAH